MEACIPPSKKLKTENSANSSGSNQNCVKQVPGIVQIPNSSNKKPGGRLNRDYSTENELETNDSNYFRCYADLSIHRVMIGDYSRTHTYRRAILSNYKLFHQKVVLDVGAGTGILSLFCVQAGAKKVYAIEASEIAKEAEKVVATNGYSDRIIVMQEKVETVEIPEKVDIIVSEWMGYMLMYESMLPSLLFARDRWLKKGGHLFPEEVRIYIAPISDYQEYEYSVEFWRKVEDAYKVDMSALAKTAAEQMQGPWKCCRLYQNLKERLAIAKLEICLEQINLLKNSLANVHVISVDPASIQSHASCVTSMQLATVSPCVTECAQGSFRCRCFGSSVIHGFVIWFTVHFPNNHILSTSPYEKETHWEQSVLYIDPFTVEQDTAIDGQLWIRRGEVYHRFLDIELEYQVNHGEKRRMKFKMKD